MDGLTVRAERLVAGGDALARLDDGRVAFVPGALPGELVRASLAEDRGDYVRLSLDSVVEPSPSRVQPACPSVAEGCGGCTLQHIERGAHLAAKVGIVREALARTGRLGDVPLRSVEGDAGPRTTVRMAVLPDGRLGFRRRASNDAVVPRSCMAAHPLIDDMLPELRASGAEEATIRCSTSTGARAIWLHDSKGRDARRAAVSGEPEDVTVDPRASVVERVAEVDMRVSMRSFFQSSARAAELLVAEVRAAAGDEATSGSLGDVVDLYGGIGLFSATVAGPRARTVVVESNPAACADARHNLRDRDAGVVSMQVEQWEPRPAGLVIADPSRTGLGRRGSAVVAAVRAPRVVLVSCDPVAGARDLRMLVDAGYALDSVAVLDLFPWTHHVETVASLTLR